MGAGRGNPFLAGVITCFSCCLVLASPAAANPVLKAGPAGETSGGFCAPSLITPSYSQQSAGVEPKVNDIFYLSLRIDLSLVTFDCANEFYSVLADLPPNVQTAIGGSATTICRRWGINANGQQVNDQRAQANCQANPAVNGNGEFSMRPVASPVLPDVGGGAGSFWFAGIRSPQESQVYDHVQLLVPIKATATMSNQPISFVVCATGSSCVNVSVPLTVTAGPAQADPPLISLPAAAQTTAVGARVPFTINDVVTGSSYYIKLDTSTNPAFPANTTAGRPCGLSNAVAYGTNTNLPFSGSSTFEAQYGDLQTENTICYLTPDTTYNFKVCTSNPATIFPFTDFPGCQTTTFSTGAVQVSLELPAEPPFPAVPTAAVRVLAGHPAGTVKVQAKTWAAAVGAFSDVTTPAAVSQSTSSSPVSNQSVSGLNQWRTYNLRGCFISGAHQPCSTALEYTTGHATTGDATEVTHQSATLSGTASSPNPALNMAILLSTNDPGTADPRQVMNSAGSGSTDANGTANPNTPASATLTGLQPETTYFWTACFNNPAAQPTLESCGAVKTFTTSQAPTFCELNPSDPTCTPDPCDDNPNLPQCTPDPCDDTPAPESCNSPPAKASLSIGNVTPIKVKRGTRGKLRVPVRNNSDTDAQRVKLCLRLPASFKGRLKLPACRTFAVLAAGKSSSPAMVVKAPSRAKPGVVKLKVSLSWSEGSRTGPARVTVRK
ncbi:MAG: hypothetical protein KDB57_09290 [Solirubrobacterales bacterium]|jgi:hypothetical protein|nr:hypothetical protein [Solirubrobacterales bacterium]